MGPGERRAGSEPGDPGLRGPRPARAPHLLRLLLPLGGPPRRCARTGGIRGRRHRARERTEPPGPPGHGPHTSGAPDERGAVCRELVEAVVPAFPGIALVAAVEDALPGEEPPLVPVRPAVPLRRAAFH